MPSWIVNSFTMLNTGLLLINFVLLLLILNYIEVGLRKKEKEGGGRPEKDESWYAHLESKTKP